VFFRANKRTGRTDTRGDQDPEVGCAERSAASQKGVLEATGQYPRGWSSRHLKQWPCGTPTTRGERRSKEWLAPGVVSTLKGKPQGRDRHETRPADSGRMKALRACETLGRHGTRWLVSIGDDVAARCREDVEGEETAREAVAGLTPDEGEPRQRRQSGDTLERSERPREETPRKSNSLGTRPGRKPQRPAHEAKVKEGAKKPYGR
jgi:hypothetical protein